MSNNILIIGDLMLDRNWVGTATRISPEAPCMVVKIDHMFDEPGGAANVAANCISLGAKIEIVGSAGPIKHRLWAGRTQLIRWDENDKCDPIVDLGGAIQSGGIHRDGKDIIFNKIIIADYAKGTITESLLEQVYKMNLPTFVDTKDDPAKYTGWVTAVFPNIVEYKQYKNSYDLFDRCILKLGENGIAELQFGKVRQSQIALATDVASVNGAGDVVIAAYAYKYPARDALTFANLAAAAAVQKPFTSTITQEDIKNVRRSLRRRDSRRNKKA